MAADMQPAIAGIEALDKAVAKATGDISKLGQAAGSTGQAISKMGSDMSATASQTDNLSKSVQGLDGNLQALDKELKQKQKDLNDTGKAGGTPARARQRPGGWAAALSRVRAPSTVSATP